MQRNLLDKLDGDESNICRFSRVVLDITNFLHEIPVHLDPTHFKFEATFFEIAITTGSQCHPVNSACLTSGKVPKILIPQLPEMSEK